MLAQALEAAAAPADIITCADVLMMLSETSASGGVTTASLGHYIAAHGLAPQLEGEAEGEAPWEASAAKASQSERFSDADEPGTPEPHRYRWICMRHKPCPCSSHVQRCL